MRTTFKKFRIPNRDIEINLDELLLINTRTFMRLYGIKQLGLANYVYPFAIHSRGFHCLDCLDMSQRFIDHLLRNIEHSVLEDSKKEELMELIKGDTKLIRVSALLHDIMHIPFSHSLEDENDVLPKGDKSKRIDKMIEMLEKELDELETSSQLYIHRFFSFQSRDEFRNSLREIKTLLKDVKKVLWTIALPDDVIEDIVKEVEKKAKQEGKSDQEAKNIGEKEKKILEKKRLDPSHYYIADVIGNTISADLLSYILRDAETTGIDMKPGGWYRLLDYLEIQKDERGRNRMVIRLTKKKGEWRQDVFSAIINILNVRYALTEQVIYHHAKCAASAMLCKIASLCDLKESEELYKLGDEGFMEFLEKKAETMIRSNDKNQKRKGEGAKKLLDSLRARRFYKRFHIIPVSKEKGYPRPHLADTYSKLENRVKLEEEIEREYGLNPGSIIIFCPGGNTALKEASALVVYEDKDSKTNEIVDVVKPLDSAECLEFLKSIHPSMVDRVKNVVEQYRALWKMYVFIDPNLIPLCGKGIKEKLKEKLGAGYDEIFDRAHLENTEAFELSKNIHQEIVNKATGEEFLKVYQQVVNAGVELQRKSGSKDPFDWLKDNYSRLVEDAIKAVRGKLLL